jgi:hypothetical protein
MAGELCFKFKINRIKYQSNNSSTCGPFALRFIADMYAGKQLKVATHFTDEHVSGESQNIYPNGVIFCKTSNWNILSLLPKV